MAKKKYRINELSKEAREKALEHLRDQDYFEPDWLTDQFKSDLEEEEFPNDKVYWSLGYTQGDGVSFYGAFDDLVDFLQKHKLWRQYKKLAPHVRFWISGERARFFGPGAMDVEYEITSEEEDLIPERLQEAIVVWKKEEQARFHKWDIERQTRIHRTGPKEWSPGPPRPYEPQEKPKRFVRAEERAKREYEELQVGVEDLQKEIQELVEEMARKLERIGYDEIDYQNSEEYLIEMAEANDRYFTEEGKPTSRP